MNRDNFVQRLLEWSVLILGVLSCANVFSEGGVSML